MLGNEFWTWFSNFKMIQRWISPRSFLFWDIFDGMQEKERVLGRGEEKTKLRGRGGVEVIVGLKIDLTCRYL